MEQVQNTERLAVDGETEEDETFHETTENNDNILAVDVRMDVTEPETDPVATVIDDMVQDELNLVQDSTTPITASAPVLRLDSLTEPIHETKMDETLSIGEPHEQEATKRVRSSLDPDRTLSQVSGADLTLSQIDAIIDEHADPEVHPIIDHVPVQATQFFDGRNWLEADEDVVVVQLSQASSQKPADDERSVLDEFEVAETPAQHENKYHRDETSSVVGMDEILSDRSASTPSSSGSKRSIVESQQLLTQAPPIETPIHRSPELRFDSDLISSGKKRRRVTYAGELKQWTGAGKGKQKLIDPMVKDNIEQAIIEQENARPKPALTQTKPVLRWYLGDHNRW
jgi:hypothetical protein